ncbi:MAG: arylesterase [Tepidimonas sp.]|uniref:arylesterase n=1 Tax=Tepidimonas sp. TaxID=2002775 RepID=UPI00259F8326|nr:arylesterase [Tepidimonas sp.]MDM7457516.1 arylesterase [Tepidimonas sp.]
MPFRAGAAEPGSGVVILVVGDSLSAEYGLARGTGWVALLERRLQEERRAVRVINASVSGDTTAGGRSRLAALLERHRPAIVVLELGGNDALRGLPLQTTRDNLRAMIRASREAGARVLLLGMDMPPNYGERYRAQFRAVYTDLAREEKVGLVPFFLAGVADGPQAAALFQDDRIHPNERAQPILRDNVWPHLQRLLPRA